MSRYVTGTIAAVALCGLIAGGPAHAQGTDEAAVLQALEAAVPGTFLHNPLDVQWTDSGSDFQLKIVDAPELTTGQAISARVKKRKRKPWETNVSVPIPEGVSTGERVQILYWMRTAKPQKGKEAGSVDIFLGRNIEPYDNILAQTVEPDGTWQMKSLTGTAGRDFPAGSIKLEYQLARNMQTIEIGPVYVSKLD